MAQTMTKPAAEETTDQTPPGRASQRRCWRCFPLILLALVIGLIVRTDAGFGDRTLPPIETLNVQRIALPDRGMIELSVINDGPDPITIAQVLVDDAYWTFYMSPLGHARPARFGDDRDPLSRG